MSTVQTPTTKSYRAKDESEGFTSHEASPSFRPVELKIAAALRTETNCYPYAPELEGLVVLAKETDELSHAELVNMLNLLIEMNPEISHRLILMDGMILYEDVEGGETPIHESAVGFINAAFYNYSTRLQQTLHLNNPIRLGGQARIKSNAFSACPDIQVAIRKRMSADPNYVIEVSYAVGLRATHRKLMRFMQEHPNIMGGMILRILHPWATEYDANADMNLLDEQDGKMVCLEYVRGNTIPVMATSFGKTPISQRNIQHIIEVTGIDINNIHGHGIEGYQPCNEDTQDTYRLHIPASFILTSDTEDPLVALLANGILQGLQPNIHELAIEINLFELRNSIHEDGVRIMNLQMQEH